MQKSYIAILGALLLAPLLAEAELAKLTVTVRGLAPATGTVEISVFNSSESFLHQPVLQQTAPVDGKDEITAEFFGMAEGDYAVVAVHDENDNGALDTGFLGFGGESFGYSNDAFSWLGRPGFDAARFAIGTEDVEILIDLD